MKVIGVIGKAGSGKDTTADYIVDKYGGHKLAFAGPLKEAARHMFLFNDEQLYGDKKNNVDEYWRVTPRRVLQYIGTDVVREQFQHLLPDVGNNFWLDNMKRRMQLLNVKDDECIVTSDTRFENEIEFIRKEMNGIIIRIDRPQNEHTIQTGEKTHASEVVSDNYDYLINNDGSLEDLYNKIDKILC